MSRRQSEQDDEALILSTVDEESSEFGSNSVAAIRPSGTYSGTPDSGKVPVADASLGGTVQLPPISPSIPPPPPRMISPLRSAGRAYSTGSAVTEGSSHSDGAISPKHLKSLERHEVPLNLMPEPDKSHSAAEEDDVFPIAKPASFNARTSSSLLSPQAVGSLLQSAVQFPGVTRKSSKPPPTRTSSSSLRRSLSMGDRSDPLSTTSSSGTFSGSGAFTGSGAFAGSGGFTSNMTRMSQEMRKSMMKSGQAALGTILQIPPKDGEEEDSTKAVKKTYHRSYNIGDNVLIDTENDRLPSCVNRFGFRPGQGRNREETKGPYTYVIGKVTDKLFEGNAVGYTVERADTGVEVKGGAEMMEPISSREGEEAAREAANTFRVGSSGEDLDGNESEAGQQDNADFALKLVENCLEITLLPFFLLYDCFVFVIGARLFRYGEKALEVALRNARLFLYGLKPYACATRITVVNILVLCKLWYMFSDQARLAFFHPHADNTLAMINFVVWSILCIELLFEIFIRPDGFHYLIQSEKAYTPTTVRYVTDFHLAMECIALALFVPEFTCLFSSSNCDARQKFSLLQAIMLSVKGHTSLNVFAGRAFFAGLRLRVFGLVRHWRNWWVRTTFLKQLKFQVEQKRISLDKSEKILAGDAAKKDDANKEGDQARTRIIQKQRDTAVINASNIGTALMVTNSDRALVMLCALLGLFPMLTLIYSNGVSNSVGVEMMKQLQGTNLLVTSESASGCSFLVDSVGAWIESWPTQQQDLITSSTQDVVLALVVQPARCQTEFEGLDAGNLTFQEVDCSSLDSQYDLTMRPGRCMLGALWDASNDKTFSQIVRDFGLRIGNIQTEHSESVDFPSGETYKVAAHFNETYTSESSALASFILQLCMIFILIVGLSFLRRDARDLVLGPLRSMLKTVARYAKNPLAQAAAVNKDNHSVFSDLESDDSLRNDDEGSEADPYGTYETEQLITAVSIITDLLRKCWGVAGADIISTNLASREGAFAEVFNPTVPGKSVYALFAFAAIKGFDHALKCLGGDVMILINDVANVLHDEVFRWGFGDSGQCNKNLGAAFLMVFRIGLVKEVMQNLEMAAKVVFDPSNKKKQQRRASPANASGVMRLKKTPNNKSDAMADAMKLSLRSLPGIAIFTDRAVIGMLKSFAGIHRDDKLRKWRSDFRLTAGVGSFSVNMIFGMDAGWAVEGAVGSEYKIDATYLSPHVNMASRMMSACNHYGVTILLSEAVQELMSDVASKKLRNLDRVTVKGSTRIQKIFTYDARHEGADFFLFSRSDEQADMEAKRYKPYMWNTDQDLGAMRHHVTEDFEAEFNAGMKAYYSGDWPTAIKRLESAGEIMVEAAMEEGYLHDELDSSPDRKELYRAETTDGPSSYLVHFMKSKGGVAPPDWAGWHPLLSK